MWQADLSGGLALVFGAEGKGLRRSCGAAATTRWRSRCRQVESLNVSVAAAVLLRGAAPSDVADSLYLFDGYNLLHAGRFAAARAGRPARGLGRPAGRPRGGRLRRVDEDATLGPLEIRYAPHADTLLERLAAEHRDRD